MINPRHRRVPSLWKCQQLTIYHRPVAEDLKVAVCVDETVAEDRFGLRNFHNFHNWAVAPMNDDRRYHATSVRR